MHGRSKQRCPAAAADIDISIYFMHSNLNSSILCISSWHCLTSFGIYSHNNGNIIEHLGISIRSARKGERARELTLFHLNYNAIFRPGGPTTTINKNNSTTTATTATRTTTIKTKKTRNHVGHDMPCTVALWAGRLQDVAKVDKYENYSFLTGTVSFLGA